MNEKIAQYIRDAREYGQEDSLIHEQLMDSGWDTDEVDSTFMELELDDKPSSPPKKEAVEEVNAQDVAESLVDTEDFVDKELDMSSNTSDKQSKEKEVDALFLGAGMPEPPRHTPPPPIAPMKPRVSQRQMGVLLVLAGLFGLTLMAAVLASGF